MTIGRIIFSIGCILIFTGILLIASGFPISVIGPLLIAAGLITVPLAVFEGKIPVFGMVCIFTGILMVLAAALIFLILGASLFVPYLLVILGLVLIASGTILLLRQC
ncbi:MAG TPA: hypothetical protein VEG39_19625 [Clostridia bacterium]|nr:hypothetical protein [Clostridia bacterium]